MADIAPFPAYRYVESRVGSLDRVITQPYDKISPEMLERYLALSPYNLAHIIKPKDYRAAAARLREWIRDGILARDQQPAVYPYFQSYRVPGTEERRTRKGFIAALRLEEYSAGVVFRHEMTMSGPKQDRLELLRATRAHCELIFMLHDDPGGEVATLLERASAREPVARLRDDYGDEHTVWRVDDPAAVEPFRRALSGRKLLVADGHHRYETALAFRREFPAAGRVLVALVSMGAPGLTILPTHRLLSGAPDFSRERLLARASEFFEISQVTPEEGRGALAPAVLGAAFHDHPAFFLLRLKSSADLASLLPDLSPAQRRLDVVLLHRILLRKDQEPHLDYLREFEKGMEAVRGGAQACFFLHPVSITHVREIAFSGGVLPQKSTDFYPKMLSGLVVYGVED